MRSSYKNRVDWGGEDRLDNLDNKYSLLFNVPDQAREPQMKTNNSQCSQPASWERFLQSSSHFPFLFFLWPKKQEAAHKSGAGRASRGERVFPGAGSGSGSGIAAAAQYPPLSSLFSSIFLGECAARSPGLIHSVSFPILGWQASPLSCISQWCVVIDVAGLKCTDQQTKHISWIWEQPATTRNYCHTNKCRHAEKQSNI